MLSTSWSSGNAFISEPGGMRFKSLDGQIVHNVAHRSPPLRHFFERSCVAGRCNDAEMGFANSLHASTWHRECNVDFNFVDNNIRIKTC